MSEHSQNNGPFDLGSCPLHLPSVAEDAEAIVPLTDFGFDGPAFGKYIEQHCQAAPGRIIMVEQSPADWPIWERHTKGDEIVYILEGEGTFIQEIDGVERCIEVSAGNAIINPAGIWHTADISVPLRALYITPADGTEHRQR